MVGVVVEAKFIRPRLDPWCVLGAFRAAGENLLAPSAANVNVARIVAAGVPSDRRLSICGPGRDRVGIRAKDYSGDGRVIS